MMARPRSNPVRCSDRAPERRSPQAMASFNDAFTPIPVRTSARSPSDDHHLECVDQDREVQQERHVLYVVQVELELPLAVLDRRAIAELHLRPSRDTRPRRMPLVVVRNHLAELLDEVRPLRSRPHEAHLSPEDVEELGQLIQAKGAEYSS